MNIKVIHFWNLKKILIIDNNEKENLAMRIMKYITTSIFIFFQKLLKMSVCLLNITKIEMRQNRTK